MAIYCSRFHLQAAAQNCKQHLTQKEPDVDCLLLLKLNCRSDSRGALRYPHLKTPASPSNIRDNAERQLYDNFDTLADCLYACHEKVHLLRTVLFHALHATALLLVLGAYDLRKQHGGPGGPGGPWYRGGPATYLCVSLTSSLPWTGQY